MMLSLGTNLPAPLSEAVAPLEDLGEQALPTIRRAASDAARADRRSSSRSASPEWPVLMKRLLAAAAALHLALGRLAVHR